MKTIIRKAKAKLIILLRSEVGGHSLSVDCSTLHQYVFRLSIDSIQPIQ